MKLTIKGQVTIPKKYRQHYGLEPNTEVVFEATPGGVLIRPAGSERVQKVRKALRRVRGIADAGLSSNSILAETREG